MELDILVQKADELDVEKAIEFIEEHENREFVLIYSAIKDRMSRLNFFSLFTNEAPGKFLAANVSGFMTQRGYHKDALAICVFSGKFEAEIIYAEIDYKNPEKTAENINQGIKNHELMITYSANRIKENIDIEKALKKIQKENPEMQMFGGVCSPSPPPMVATREGIFTDAIGGVLIKNIDYSFNIDTGFEIDIESAHEYKITNADEDAIYEINGKNAAEEYQRIQQVRDYLFNRVMDMGSSQDIMDMPKVFPKANKIMSDVMRKTFKDLLANKSEHGFVNLFAVAKIGDNYIKPGNMRPEGTILQKTKSTPEKQLRAYDRVKEKYSDAKGIILSDCAMRPFYYEYKVEEAVKRIKDIECPLIIPFVWGEFGTYTPYRKGENVLHISTLKALVF